MLTKSYILMHSISTKHSIYETPKIYVLVQVTLDWKHNYNGLLNNACRNVTFRNKLSFYRTNCKSIFSNSRAWLKLLWECKKGLQYVLELWIFMMYLSWRGEDLTHNRKGTACLLAAPPPQHVCLAPQPILRCRAQWQFTLCLLGPCYSMWPVARK